MGTGLTVSVPIESVLLETVMVVKLVAVTLTVDVVSTSDSSSTPFVATAVGMASDSVTTAEEETSEIGQTVVVTATTSVVTWPILLGQSVTVTGQLVITYVLVE